MPDTVSQIVDINNRLVGTIKDFNNVYAEEGKKVDILLVDHGLVKPLDVGQVNMPTRQKANLKRDLLPIITTAVGLSEFESEILELGYASIQACIDDLSEMFAGGTLLSITNNFTEAKQARVKLAPLIDDDLIFAQLTALISVSDDIRVRHVKFNTV